MVWVAQIGYRMLVFDLLDHYLGCLIGWLHSLVP